MKYIKEYNEYIDPFNEDDWDEVEIGSFLTWLKSKYSDESKWKYITKIDCHYNNLTDLIGIDKLINLKYLFCGYNQLTKLDLSMNIKLEYLSCHHNQLTKLDLSKNVKLRVLYCHYNQLTELDLSNNINLRFLDCHYNQLTELDVSKNIKLNILSCRNNYKNIKLIEYVG